jgi:hypothetical protein
LKKLPFMQPSALTWPQVKADAPHGARQPMPGFCLAMEALGALAMALVNPAILRTPPLATAASTKQGRIIDKCS